MPDDRAAAEIGRYQIVAADNAVQFLVDTATGRTWHMYAGRWQPLSYEGGSPMPAPKSP